jgi:hypothetical protein
MPRPPEHQKLLNYIMAFLDEMASKYTIFDNFNIQDTSLSPPLGWVTKDELDLPSLFFRVEGYYMSRDDIEKNVKVLLETQHINYSNIRGDELVKIMMKFLDDFFEDYLVIENKKEKVDNNWQRKGFRAVRDRTRVSLSYKITGIIPSREEMESQVRAFIQMKKF